MPVLTDTPGESPGVPRLTTCHVASEKTKRSINPPTTAPMSCDTIHKAAICPEILPPPQTPKVTAGLLCPPEIWPRAEIRTAIIHPCAIAIPRSPTLLMMDAAPTKQNANVATASAMRSEEHTSELQSLAYLVCRLLLEKKKY